VRVAGIDPGTGSMDVIVIDDEGPRLLYEESVPRARVTENPGIILDLVDRIIADYGVEAIALPSGYGIPFNYPGTLEEAIREATFVNERDLRESLQIHGLRRIMESLSRRGDVRTFFTPGVIHLPTVPAWRKANRIDMGTADKIFTVAAALWTERERYGTPPGESSFIVVEAGLAYTAAIAVEQGMIVDGVGGTSGFTGFLGLGGMDSELAYVMAEVEPGFSRRRLFQGGAASLAGVEGLSQFEEAVVAGDPRAASALEALAEAVVKDVAILLSTMHGDPARIYVSGRLFRASIIGPRLRAGLEALARRFGLSSEIAGVARLGGETKEAATGAALLASGYAGGRFRWIVESLRLEESSGSLFDHILLPGVGEKAKRAFRGGSFI